MNEAILAQAAVLARDLELFAQHARRTVVCPDDVKLLVRRSPSLAAELQREARRLAAEAQVVKERRKAQRGKRAGRGAGRGAANGVRTDPPPEDGDDGDVLELQ